MPVVYTIGHSNRELSEFVGLLARNGITAIADVRSQPYSRTNPHFNRIALHEVLLGSGVAYVFLGDQLGGRGTDPKCYVNGKIQYDRIAQTPSFESGLTRIEYGISKNYRIALMCAEKEPLVCHRAILIARHLVKRGINVKHIIDPQLIEDHATSLRRLLRALRLENQEMFGTAEDIEDWAYRKQAEKIAFGGDGKHSGTAPLAT